MLCYHGKLSLAWFLLSLTVGILPNLWSVLHDIGLATEYAWWIIPTYFVLAFLFLKCLYTGFSFQVSIRSVLLGSFLAIGIYISRDGQEPWYLFGWYLCIMCFFHYSEFLAIAWCNPGTLSVDSFILNHSVEYGVAAVTSWVEFALTAYFLPGLKSFTIISWIGVVMCLAGELLRKTAMVTAGTNFDHIVQTEKEKKHQLVITGVYSYCRHPSYVGWFYWSFGTQLVLLNPICSVAYLLASWKFFRDRVDNEERTLLCFFGEEYMKYQRTVGTGLPGIRGYLVDD